MSTKKSLFISGNDSDILKEFHFELDIKNSLSILLSLGNILNIQLFSNDILVITYEKGEIRMDGASEHLKKLKIEEL